MNHSVTKEIVIDFNDINNDIIMEIESYCRDNKFKTEQIDEDTYKISVLNKRIYGRSSASVIENRLKFERSKLQYIFNHRSFLDLDLINRFDDYLINYVNDKNITYINFDICWNIKLRPNEKFCESFLNRLNEYNKIISTIGLINKFHNNLNMENSNLFYDRFFDFLKKAERFKKSPDEIINTFFDRRISEINPFDLFMTYQHNRDFYSAICRQKSFFKTYNYAPYLNHKCVKFLEFINEIN